MSPTQNKSKQRNQVMDHFFPEIEMSFILGSTSPIRKSNATRVLMTNKENFSLGKGNLSLGKHMTYCSKPRQEITKLKNVRI